MYKTILSLLILIAAVTGLQAGEKQFITFDANKIQRQKNSKYCVINSSNNTISISGGAPEEKASWQHLVLPFPFKPSADKTFIISGEICASDMSGAFKVAARLVDASGKTISYQGVDIKKNQDWTPFFKEFTVSDKVAKLRLYLVGIKLGSKSKVELRKFAVEEKLQNQNKLPCPAPMHSLHIYSKIKYQINTGILWY
eukprot:TRINITY_DN13155_c0_g2_i1.p1 TRINITY_DN13155_c0_g2~~TRINITY_DN13155_c0_g2_i1.p1  ORF type:complete len:198 (+),score=-3.62 TRINITY_DN13155_c0_g2_i1:224-817(+)